MWLVATIFNSTGPAAVYLMFERDPEVKREYLCEVPSGLCLRGRDREKSREQYMILLTFNPMS